MTESPQVNGRQLRHSRKETKDGRTTNRVAASCHTRTARRVPANRDACHTGRSRRRYQDRSNGNGEGRIPAATLGYRTVILPSTAECLREESRNANGEYVNEHLAFLQGENSLPGEYSRSEERRVGKECRSRWSP